jgi:hypothetical protein
MTRCQHKPVNLFDPPATTSLRPLPMRCGTVANGPCARNAAQPDIGEVTASSDGCGGSCWAFCPGGRVRLREVARRSSVRLQDKRQGALINHEFAAAGRGAHYHALSRWGAAPCKLQKPLPLRSSNAPYPQNSPRRFGSVSPIGRFFAPFRPDNPHRCVDRSVLNNLGPLTRGIARYLGSDASAIAWCPRRIITWFALEGSQCHNSRALNSSTRGGSCSRW